MNSFVRNNAGMAVHSDNHIAFFARTDFRGDRRLFGIRQPDGRAHMYIIGRNPHRQIMQPRQYF